MVGYLNSTDAANHCANFCVGADGDTSHYEFRSCLRACLLVKSPIRYCKAAPKPSLKACVSRMHARGSIQNISDSIAACVQKQDVLATFDVVNKLGKRQKRDLVEHGDVAMKLLKLIVTGLAMISLGACSKTVQWEEEVPLNTGETIVVKRSGSYTYKGLTSDGNAFSWNPEWRSTIEFAYKGKQYTHTDAMTLVLIAIASDGTPNLAATAGSEWSRKHNYYCVTPSYVQLRPDGSGKVWTWPEKIDPWLYGLSTNLVFGLAALADDGKRFTPADRRQKNASLTGRYKEFETIDPTYLADNCPKRKQP